MAFEAGTGGTAGGRFIPPSPSPGPSPPPLAAPLVAPLAAPPAPPSTVTTPSYSPSLIPNYSSIIASSPYVVAAQALAQQQLATLRSQLGANAARALVNLGDYGLASQVAGLNLPGGTADLVARGNKAGTSVLAQLGYQHGQKVQAIPAALAGRGFYRSGETGTELGREDRSYGQQQYTARQTTLDYLNSLYQNYLTAQFGVQQSQITAQFDAYKAALAQAAAGTYNTPQTTQAQAPAPAPITAATYSPQTAPYGVNYLGQPIDLGGVGVNPATGLFMTGGY